MFIPVRQHPFPFRTRQLSLSGSMVLAPNSVLREQIDVCLIATLFLCPFLLFHSSACSHYEYCACMRGTCLQIQALFYFSFPRVPRVASLPFFSVLVVKEKIKNHPKFASQRKNTLVRFCFKLFYCIRQSKNFLKNTHKKYFLVIKKIKNFSLYCLHPLQRAEGGLRGRLRKTDGGIKFSLSKNLLRGACTFIFAIS